MCGSMVDMQSATAEIRRGKKKRNKKKKPHGKNIISASATQGCHKQCGLNWGLSSIQLRTEPTARCNCHKQQNDGLTVMTISLGGR